MRDILVEHARRKSRRRHGGEARRVELDAAREPRFAFDVSSEQIVALDAALTRMKAVHPRHAELVMLRFFAGLSNQLAAQTLNIALRTVERDWRFARAWLHKELSGSNA
jgi:RNA polymerase sigma factor (TIGR02999 family)